MLIGSGGRYEGILSGGCLEGDLAAHAASVLETGTPKMVRYDNGGDDDLLWGLGAGCEGGMDVWLVRLDPAANWEPFATLSRCFEQRVRARYAFVLDSAVPALPVGSTLWVAGGPAPPHGLPERLTAFLAAQAGTDLASATAGIVEFDSPRVRLFRCVHGRPTRTAADRRRSGRAARGGVRCHAGLARDRGGSSAGVRRPGAISARTTRAADHAVATGAARGPDAVRCRRGHEPSHRDRPRGARGTGRDADSLRGIARPRVASPTTAGRPRDGNRGEVRGAPACTGRPRTRRARSGEHRARDHRGDPGAPAWQGTRAGTRSQHCRVEPARDAARGRQFVAFRFAQAARRHRGTAHARAHARHGARSWSDGTP